MTASPKWIVAATGSSLTEEVAEQCKDWPVIAVNDAYRLFPYAHALYAADADWWALHNGVPGFTGEKWITVNDHCMSMNRPVAQKYGLRMVWSERRAEGFSFRPGRIHLGSNSGFQAVNLALLWGATLVVLVGFDMKGSHFFGDHPQMPRRLPHGGKGFPRWIRNFTRASELLPAGIRIINATPDSALTCFPMMPLEEALNA
jgi:hypothetical protein